MAQDKDLKTPNVPPLRFPGFTDKWKESTIGNVVKIGNGRDYKHLGNGSIPVFGTGGYMTSVDDYLYDGETVFIGRKGSIDKPFYFSGKFWTVDTLFYTYDFNGVIPKFLYSIFQRINWKKYNEASGVPSLSKATIEKIKFKYPLSPEQDKISRLLSLIDERIATQNKIIEDLKKLKSAIMAITFGKSNVTKNQWREVRLGNICERVTRRNSNNISNLILTIAAQYGLVSQIDFFNKSVASADLSNYYLLDKGDFAYNKSYSGEYTWGAVKRLDLYPQGVLSPLYICFRPMEGIIDSDFLVYLFESKCWYREVSEICVEGARNHGLLNVSVVDFFNMKLHLPDLSEQKRIAEMMNAISDKIEHSSRLYALYNNQKTYLLSNMFI
ncbi:restriction endonuclease subunit S [Xylanibacter rodentium]|uniref:restriction endonuclease subunit S n=1 Tax=Xylanibacter rodentium TaxID=2736289 RepID=UPI002557CFC4|nr:restriction endonuclease subunit S [Xylanibacter rodentium]